MLRDRKMANGNNYALRNTQHVYENHFGLTIDTVFYLSNPHRAEKTIVFSLRLWYNSTKESKDMPDESNIP